MYLALLMTGIAGRVLQLMIGWMVLLIVTLLALMAIIFFTAENKNTSLKKLISDTANCAKDTTKGFSISNVLNICYTPELIRQAVGSYEPVINLSGYASINGVPYVLFGNMSVRGGLDGYSDNALNKAGDDFIAGKIPAPTQKNIDSLLEAFKNSSVTYK